MNPSSEGLKDRASTSPALFNRCVLNWVGDWSDSAFYQVGRKLTSCIDLEKANWLSPGPFAAAFVALESLPPTHRDAVVMASINIHQTFSRAYAQDFGPCIAITPRHYLDFINQFVKLYHEKLSDLEEQQAHLNVGLSKIAETVEQVEDMQKSLAVKSQELQTINEAVDAKVSLIANEQNEAEQKNIESQEIQVTLEQQTVAIAAKKKDVMAELDVVKPAVIEAQQAVEGITKQHLVEIRSLGNPPAPVKLALEAICLLLGEATSDWKTIRSIIMRKNFISSIINFSTEDISDPVRNQMNNTYLNNPDFTFDKVNNASKACGPLVKWATAQVSSKFN